MDEVTLYTTAGCHLCTKALEILFQVREEIPFHLETIDIKSDPELYEKYKYDIPVVLFNGKEIARHRIREEQLLACLRNVLNQGKGR